MKKDTDIDRAWLRQKLNDQRHDLIQDTKRTAHDREAVELDQSSVGRLSRMDALQIQAMNIETERRRNVQLARIKSALKRMDDGEYGCCTVCGEDIQSKRLEHNPAVPTCITCAGS